MRVSKYTQFKHRRVKCFNKFIHVVFFHLIIVIQLYITGMQHPTIYKAPSPISAAGYNYMIGSSKFESRISILVEYLFVCNVLAKAVTHHVLKRWFLDNVHFDLVLCSLSSPDGRRLTGSNVCVFRWWWRHKNLSNVLPFIWRLHTTSWVKMESVPSVGSWN